LIGQETKTRIEAMIFSLQNAKEYVTYEELFFNIQLADLSKPEGLKKLADYLLQKVPDIDHSEMRCRIELAAIARFGQSVMECFSSQLNEVDFRNFEKDGNFELLAQAKQVLTIDPYGSLFLIERARQAFGLDPIA
jgi:hypothetical protein